MHNFSVQSWLFADDCLPPGVVNKYQLQGGSKYDTFLNNTQVCSLLIISAMCSFVRYWRE